MSHEDTYALLVLSEEMDYSFVNMIATIVILMLIWYFIRVSIKDYDVDYDVDYYKNDYFSNKEFSNTPVPLDVLADSSSATTFMQETSDLLTDLNKNLVVHRDFALTDGNYFAGPLMKGDYGNVPTYLYNDYDNERTQLWRKPYNGIYLPNSKEYWKSINYPIEADSWIANGEPYSYPYYSHNPK
jgi:hypothetical protein